MNIIIKIFAVSVALTSVYSCGSSRKAADSVSGPNDEVVNLGYGETTKKANTYATGSVKVNQKEIMAYTNIFDYLRGRVPGVDVKSDNSIVIRGVGTNSGNTDPLFLVDGVEVSDISTIDPQTVDSIDVLKDASASIYGARGANGVIMITLKR